MFKGEGKTVTYTSGDLTFTGTLTIKNGARFYQNADSWPNFANGTLIVENGTFDLSHATGSNGFGTLIVREGGSVIVPSGMNSNKVTLDNGATLVLKAGDFEIPSDRTFGAINLTVYTITTPANDNVRAKISLSGTKLTATRTGAVCGIWDARYAGEVNFLSGANSSFTFPSSVDGNNVHDKATAYQYLFQTGYFYYEGNPVSDESDIWRNHFEVFSDAGMTTVAYVDVISDNSISSVSAESITSTSATLSALIASQEEGSLVKFAYGESELTESDVLSGETISVEAGVASKQITGLNEFALYHYAFAIADSTGSEVLSMRSGTFIASDFEYIWKDGAWVGGRIPANYGNSLDSVLFASDFTTTGELRLDNKKVKNSVLTSGTMHYGTLQVVNSSVINTRNEKMNEAPYGFYGDNATPLNFVSESGNGTIFRAASYTCRCDDAQLAAFDNFFTCQTAKKILHNGVQIDATDYAANFARTTAAEKESGTFDYGEGVVAVDLNVVTLTLWDTFPEDASGAWTVKNGARVKLTKNIKLSGLVVESGAVIDLNGYTLTTSALTIDGVNVGKGTYSSSYSEVLVGEGSLSVAGNGLVIVIR